MDMSLVIRYSACALFGAQHLIDIEDGFGIILQGIVDTRHSLAESM